MALCRHFSFNVWDVVVELLDEEKSVKTKQLACCIEALQEKTVW